MINVAAGTSVTAIQDIVDNAAAGSTINLAAGTYVFTNTLRIDRDDITIKGAGVGLTKIVTDASVVVSQSGGVNKYLTTAIEVRGYEGEVNCATLTSATTSGSTKTLHLSNVNNIEVGSVIQLLQPNDDAYLAESGNSHLIGRDIGDLREMLARVTAVNGNTVTISCATPFDFAAGATKVSIPDMIRNVTVSDLSISSNLPAADPFDFTNENEAGYITGAFRVAYADGINICDISLNNSATHGFEFTYIIDVNGDRLSTNGSHNKGPEGNGYAFFIKHGFNNTFTNLVDKDMRHGVIFGSFSAEHYNTIHVKSTNRDVNFHGGPDSGNYIKVDSSILSYNGDNYKPIVGPGNPKLHPVTDIFNENTVLFHYARGSEVRDTIYGFSIGNKGADLAGCGSDDILVGTAKADLLNGGADQDTITGGAGADTFVFRRGFDDDIIRDMQCGPSGDIIDLRGTGVTSAEMLSLRKIGTDTVLSLGGGDCLLLEDVSPSSGFRFVFSAATAGRTIEATGSDHGLSGTALDDTFIVKTGYISISAKNPYGIDVLGGEGTDTLRIVDGVPFDSANLGRLGTDYTGKTGRADGIDVIDVTYTSAQAHVDLDSRFIAQSDNGYVTIKLDGTGVKVGTGGIADPDQVRVSGNGLVVLNNDGAVISSSGSAVNVRGGSGDDYIKGSNRADTIDAASGEDRICGRGGADVLWAGGDKDEDVFVYLSRRDSGSNASDKIHEFDDGEDKFDFSAMDADSGMSGDQAFRYVQKFAEAKSSQADGQLRVLHVGDIQKILVDTNGDGSVDMTIDVYDAKDLAVGDFIL